MGTPASGIIIIGGRQLRIVPIPPPLLHTSPASAGQSAAVLQTKRPFGHAPAPVGAWQRLPFAPPVQQI
jgi:hypothetical protein